MEKLTKEAVTLFFLFLIYFLLDLYLFCGEEVKGTGEKGDFREIPIFQKKNQIPPIFS